MVIVPWALAVIGLAVVAGGVYWLRSVGRFEAGAHRAGGVVTGLVESRAADRKLMWTPVVRFTLPDGRTIEGEADTGAHPPPAQQGEPVTVVYDADDPNRFDLARSIGLTRAVAIALIVVGGGVAALGVVLGLIFLMIGA